MGRVAGGDPPRRRCLLGNSSSGEPGKRLKCPALCVNAWAARATAGLHWGAMGSALHPDMGR